MDSASLRLAPSATLLCPADRGAVLVCGSHGGRYVGRLAAQAGVRAIILHDAGIGRDEAGVGALALLESLGIAAAAASHLSCRIGDAEDMMTRGLISRANAQAGVCGVTADMGCAEAAALLRKAPSSIGSTLDHTEERLQWTCAGQKRIVVLVDSAALVDPSTDADAIVVTGSHGGLVGGDARKALRADAFAAFFNDAGIGIEDAGVSRLPPLDRRGVAGVAVAASSARIGDARSTLFDGIVSRINARAFALGAREGDSAHELIQRWAVSAAAVA